jgi:two-component system OmpR family sensor kinase
VIHAGRRAQRPGKPLSVRLSVIIATVVALGLCLAGSAITVALKMKLTAEVDRQLTATLSTWGAPSQLDAAMSGPSDYVLMIFGDDGALLREYTAVSGQQRPLPDIEELTPEEADEHGGQPFTVRASEGHSTWRAVAARLVEFAPPGAGGSPGSGKVTTGSVVLALPLDSVTATTHAMGLMVIWSAVTAAVLASLGGYVMVRRSLKPLRAVEQSAARIAGGDLSTRVQPGRPGTEVGRLTDSLNAMLAQIEDAFAVQSASETKMRSFVSDASHELRTPLAAIRGYAELYRIGGLPDTEAQAGAMRRIEDEAARMGLLVSDLLTLARLDESQPLALGPVDLSMLAEDALADASALDPAREVTLVRLSQGDGPSVLAEEAALRRVVMNLVANAVRHTPDGSPIELAVGAEADGRALLEVRDHGPGVPEATRAKVFDRFFRMDGSRSRDSGGTGLGLAIVAGLVAAHGGEVQVTDTAGGGATFRVLLPAARAA